MTDIITTNRLSREKSPYLLQHAHNPVDWYPWGEEALNKAKNEDKPIFLSIGYSSCHWCHVIAHESFSDAEVAGVLNRAYISIKVDKEERPDLDSVYMAACQAMTGSGGWPMTIIALPDGRPFYAATYLPKAALIRVLTSIEALWQSDRAGIAATAANAAKTLAEYAEIDISKAKHPPEASALIHDAYALYESAFDDKWGGFGTAPKFPSPHTLLFLLWYSNRTGEKRAREMAERTLDRMYRGGIFDHIGGGFSRYSTDEKWLVPHFEKMLYDNALLIWAYSEGYRVLGKEQYRRAVEKTVDYLLREMTGPDGEFYGSQDADSEGSEGKYYTFTPDEITGLLGEENGMLFCKWYGITKGGNFEGKSIPNRIGAKDTDENNAHIDALGRIVYEWRKNRVSLHRDDKVLTVWNAMAIHALAFAARVFSNDVWLEAANKSAEFLLHKLRGNDGRLYIRWRDGEAKYTGITDDYAYLGLALIALGHVKEAGKLADILLEHFFDNENGGFYLYASDAERLYIRPKDCYDGAVPSGNSAALHLLSGLYTLTGEEKWREPLEKQRRYLALAAERNPSGFVFALMALEQDHSTISS